MGNKLQSIYNITEICCFRRTVKHKEIKCNGTEMESVKNIVNLFSSFFGTLIFGETFHDFYAFSSAAIVREMLIVFVWYIYRVPNDLDFPTGSDKAHCSVLGGVSCNNQ